MKHTIGESSYNAIVSCITSHPPSLWGVDQGGYILQCLDCMLYHDMEDISYNAIEDMLSDRKIPHNTMLHNSHVIRRSLRVWAESYIRLGTCSDWNAATRNLSNMPTSLKDVNLWIDSFDVQVKGTRSTKVSDPTWSYKLNAPGRRYMVIQNGKRKIVQIWGGHSPKIHDGSWLETHREEFEDQFNGARFVGDEHFSKGKKLFSGKKRKFEDVDAGDDDAVDEESMTNAQKQFKRDHASLRARVETPFAWLKNALKAFSGGVE